MSDQAVSLIIIASIVGCAGLAGIFVQLVYVGKVLTEIRNELKRRKPVAAAIRQEIKP